jgi:hypothetical protein
MSHSLSDAQQGERFRAAFRERIYDAHIMLLDGDLWAVVDYTPVFRIEDIPVVWARLPWEKVA